MVNHGYDEEQSINKHFPFTKIFDEDRPQECQVRMSVKSKGEFASLNKYVLKKPLNFNQYKSVGNQDEKISARLKFQTNKEVMRLHGQNDSWQQVQTARLLLRGNPHITKRAKQVDDNFKDRLI